MTARNRKISRAAGFLLCASAVLTALFFLQVLDEERHLLSWLAAFGLVALAALTAVGTLRFGGVASPFCLATSGCFVGYIALRALASPAAYAARSDLYLALAALLVYGLAASVFNTAAKRLTLLIPLLLFAVIHVALAIAQAGKGENLALLIPWLEAIPQGSRATGLYVSPNHLAGLLEILAILGLSVACWSRQPAWARVFVGYLATLCFVGLALTGSRGGYLSAAASLIVFLGLSLIVLRARSFVHLVKWGGLGLVLLAAALVALWVVIGQDAIRGDQLTRLATDDARLGLWQAAIEQWKLQPVTGTGSGTYLFYGRQFRSDQMQMDPVDVHNDYLHLLAEYGLVGGAAFLLFFGAHLRQGWRSFRSLGPERAASGAAHRGDRLALTIGSLAAVSACAVHSVFDYNLHIPANALLLAFVFGLLANAGRNPRKEPRSKEFAGLRLTMALLALLLLLQCARLLPGEHYANLARAALWDENPAAAVVLAEKALDHEGENPHIFFYLGRALAALAAQPERAEDRPLLFERALAALEQARQLVPLDGSYPLEKALLYDRLKRFPEAEEMYQLARARDPRLRSMEHLYQYHLDLWKQREPEVPAAQPVETP